MNSSKLGTSFLIGLASFFGDLLSSLDDLERPPTESCPLLSVSMFSPNGLAPESLEFTEFGCCSDIFSVVAVSSLRAEFLCISSERRAYSCDFLSGIGPACGEESGSKASGGNGGKGLNKK